MSINNPTLTELKEKLNTLLECDALELIPDEKSYPSLCHNTVDTISNEPFVSNRLYIPYMMNDALEYYLMLEDCQMIGNFSKRIPKDTTLEIISNVSSANNSQAATANGKGSCTQNSITNTISRYALIFHYNNGSILTIWFSECLQVLNFYQYHRIGHFWTEGQEHLRRLVYIIGTLHEKFTYLGTSACNEIEQSLLPLIEFAPFRYWSPLHESLDDYYCDSEEGLLCMYNLAIEAGDKSYARMIRFYHCLPYMLQSTKCIQNILAKKLASPKREALYELLCRKIHLASKSYAVRDYGEKTNAEIEKIRTQFSEKLYAEGFTGQYPYFQKGRAKLVAMEEHPFTILESDTYTFKIRGMVTDKKCHYLYPHN